MSARVGDDSGCVLERLEGRAMLSAGFVDPSFGVGGFTAAKISSSSFEASAIAVQSDGKIVSAAQVFRPLHITAEGTSGVIETPTARFDSSGTAEAWHTPELDWSLKSLLAIPNGRVLTLARWGVARYAPDGTVEGAFRFDVPLRGGFEASPSQMCRLADGRLVVAFGQYGGKYAPLYWPVAVVFNPDGSRDKTVGIDGVIYVHARYAQGTAVAVQPDGKLLVATYRTGVNSVYRFNRDGSVDASFGRSGRWILPVRGQTSDLRIVVQSGGRIVIGVASSYEAELYRLDGQGHLDSGFGDRGTVRCYAVMPFRDLMLQTDDKLIVVGGAIARYTADGHLDHSFGTCGLWLPSLWSSWAADSAAIGPDGRIVAALTRAPGLQAQMRLVRLTNDSDPITSDERKYKADPASRSGYDGQLTAKLDAVPQPEPGRAGLTFTVRYSDALGISVDSLSYGDTILVAGPNRFEQEATLISTKVESGGKVVFGTYKIHAPDGRWDDADIGTYRIVLGQYSALNLLGNSLPRQKLGAFKFTADVM